MITERKPAIFIPSLYFAEGLPYTIVMMMSGVFFKTLGADNIFVGLTSFLGLPWILKFAWAPLVDHYATKRTWVVFSQFALAFLCGAVAVVALFSKELPFNTFVGVAVIVLALTAFASATQDVSIDGYYLDALDEKQQAFYVGVRNAAYKVAWLFGSGAMVYLAGIIGVQYGSGFGWAASFGICSIVMLICGLFHSWYLPRMVPLVKNPVAYLEKLSEASERPATANDPNWVATGPQFFKAISTYFQQPGIKAIIFYILAFRFGDALMLKQAPNFLLDPVAKGGLAVPLAELGIISGTVGVIALLLGGILGSWLLSRGGLKRWMWPLALIQSGAILFYYALAQWPNTFVVNGLSVQGNPFVPAVYVVNSAEQFAYGLGVAAYTVFLLSTVKSDFKAAHYATATAMMALGVMIPQALSGYLTQLGYAPFFLISFLASLPGVVAIFFLPIWRSEESTAVETTAVETTLERKT